MSIIYARNGYRFYISISINICERFYTNFSLFVAASDIQADRFLLISVFFFFCLGAYGGYGGYGSYGGAYHGYAAPAVGYSKVVTPYAAAPAVYGGYSHGMNIITGGD